MKLLLLSFLIGAACAAKIVNEDIKAFEKEFNVVIPDKEMEKAAAEKLEKVEKEINENNKKFDEGKSTFQEKLYPESILPKAEFEKEKEGLIMPPEATIAANARFIPNEHHGKGLILPPESERYGPENDARLAEIDAELDRATVPASFDSVKKGWVTAVKSQGNCGSCAAFGATGLHEVCMIKAGAKAKGLDLSEQYLVDCAYNLNKGARGCNGAHPDAYTKWFINNKGEAPHESKYKYLAKKGTCKKVANYPAGAKVVSYKSAFSMTGGEARIKKAVATHGAVMVGIYASDNSFDNYAKGVYSGCTSQKPNHAVLVVGYGTLNGVKYWNVKNSWGAKWGAKGYVKIKRGTNECGIEKDSMLYVTCKATSGTGTTAAATKATASTKKAAATTAAPSTTASTCDMSGVFGPGRSFAGTLNLFTPWKGLISSNVTCVKSICKPTNPTGITNACMYICGQKKC